MRFALQTVMEDSFPDVLERVRTAEQAGFDLALVPDHFYTGAGALTRGAVAEAHTVLTALAVSTSRIRVGGAVLCNLFRHPCLTANATATLDRISGGRVELGLGAGWLADEFRRTGIPFPRPGVRIRMLEEALAVILPALEGRSVSHRGEFYRVEEFELQPGPFQAPRPPLHIGGGGDRLLELAARHAEVVSVIPPNPTGRLQPASLVDFEPEHLDERIAFLRRAAERAGRDPSSLEVLAYCPVVRVTASAAESGQLRESLARGLGGSERALRDSPMLVAGTAEELREIFAERRERYGLGGFILAGVRREELEVLGREVLPKLV